LNFFDHRTSRRTRFWRKWMMVGQCCLHPSAGTYRTTLWTSSRLMNLTPAENWAMIWNSPRQFHIGEQTQLISISVYY
jgi:hypothetical protein